MRITKSASPTRNVVRRVPVTGSTSITGGIKNNRASKPVNSNSSNVRLTPEQRIFCNQLTVNSRRGANLNPVMGATNTTNIMARPDFLELLPMFVQKLLLLDVMGSVAMKSRQQLIPYFKFIAENTKGETQKGTILSSPFVNRQGIDPNFTGRVVKNELMAEGTEIEAQESLAYTPVLPGSFSLLYSAAAGVESNVSLKDDGAGNLVDADGAEKGYIDYTTGLVDITDASISGAEGDKLFATYQYDNENVGPDPEGKYGAKMAKGYLQLDEINLVAEAHELACYWSVYSAFAAQQEYGASVSDIAKEAAIGEITAEINSYGFDQIRKASAYKPQFNWDASPVVNGSVVPSDYLNMFKLKLSQAAASIYQATRLTQPNRLIVGTNVAAYISMINGFQAESTEENIGPYKLGELDQFSVYVDPNYNPDIWCMLSKSSDIRRCSALYGEYMPVTETGPVTLADMSVQNGLASMFDIEVINPATIVQGRILGAF